MLNGDGGLRAAERARRQWVNTRLVSVHWGYSYRVTTTKRNIRVPDHIWAAAQARAEREGRTVSAVVVESLRRYANGETL